MLCLSSLIFFLCCNVPCSIVFNFLSLFFVERTNEGVSSQCNRRYRYCWLLWWHMLFSFSVFHLRPPPPLRKIFFFLWRKHTDDKIILIYPQKFLPCRKNIYLGDWLDLFPFFSFCKAQLFFYLVCVWICVKTAFLFLTASAAKEAMLPYFPQIVEYLKVTQDNFFTVYSEINVEQSVFTWHHVRPITVFQTSPVGVFFSKFFFCLNEFA